MKVVNWKNKITNEMKAAPLGEKLNRPWTMVSGIPFEYKKNVPVKAVQKEDPKDALVAELKELGVSANTGWKLETLERKLAEAKAKNEAN